MILCHILCHKILCHKTAEKRAKCGQDQRLENEISIRSKSNSWERAKELDYSQRADTVQGLGKALTHNPLEINKTQRFTNPGVQNKEESFKDQGSRYSPNNRASQQRALGIQ